MKKQLWRLFRSIGLASSLQLRLNGYLMEKGWFISFDSQKQINHLNEPIPWLSYPFLHFLEPRLKPNMLVFEFGAGNSTLWFSKRVAEVHSVEHNPSWFQQLKHTIPQNVKLTFKEDGINGEYAKEVNSENIPYDLIIIDANDRFHCTLHALETLSPQGVIILDNAERSEYKPIYDLLQEKGFKNIEFEGMLAGTHVTDVTTVFYRPNNCLGI